MAKPGLDHQRLVEMIEIGTYGANGFVMESNKLLPDKDTGQLREFDIVLTFTHGHHPIRVALECRDRSRRVGVPDVEQFFRKCERADVARGVIVSSKGFAKTALRKAESCKIGCLTLEEAAAFSWCLAPGVFVRERRNLFVDIRVVPTDASFRSLDGLYTEDGRIVDAGRARLFGTQLLNRISPTNEEPAQRYSRAVSEDSPRLYVVDERGNRSTVKRLTATLSYDVVEKFAPFDFREYFDRAKGTRIATAAVAKIDFGGSEGKIMILRRDGADYDALIVGAPPGSGVMMVETQTKAVDDTANSAGEGSEKK